MTEATPIDFPKFKYHPDPLATGSVKASAGICLCCGRSRGFIYVGPTYAIDEFDEALCPWCIADGSAAKKFDAEFVDGYGLEQFKLKEGIVAEVRYCTPSYIAWQQEQWLAHCDDACEFHGDPSQSDLTDASSATREEWMTRNAMSEEDWTWRVERYEPGGSIAFYKFECRHCRMVLFADDAD